MSLSYAAFHLVFVFPPLALLVATAESPLAGRERAAPAGLALLAAIALVYTTPWDNHLIAVGVWDYPPGSVLARVWNAPVEEYLFFVLQPLLTGLWLARLPTRSGVSGGLSVLGRAVGVLGGLAVGAAGLLLLGPDSRYYLGTLLVWSGPVLAIQWGFGWQVLWALRRTLALGVLAPTAYLWTVDRIALHLGVWRLDPRYLTGFEVLGLPVEEMSFFLLTNLFVVQGLLLFWWTTDRWPAVRDRSSRPRTAER